MAHTAEVSYADIKDFRALPVFRGLCASKASAFKISGLSDLGIPKLLEEANRGQNKEVRITKAVALKGNHSLPSSVAALVAKLHTLAAGIFHNTSHALELPWERYLAEMHELQAQGDDELRLSNGDPVELAWSTMILLFDAPDYDSCTVLFGEAMTVFSEGALTTFSGTSQATSRTEGARAVYYIRPNHKVFYTRGAGALMTPLSDKEYQERQRVEQLAVQV